MGTGWPLKPGTLVKFERTGFTDIAVFIRYDGEEPAYKMLTNRGCWLLGPDGLVRWMPRDYVTIWCPS